MKTLRLNVTYDPSSENAKRVLGDALNDIKGALYESEKEGVARTGGQIGSLTASITGGWGIDSRPRGMLPPAKARILKRRWDVRSIQVWMMPSGKKINVLHLGTIQFDAPDMKTARVLWRKYIKLIRDGGRTVAAYEAAHEAMKEHCSYL